MAALLSVAVTIGLRPAPARAVLLCGLAVLVEFARVLSMAHAEIAAGLAGGAALCLFGLGTSRTDLGLAGGRWAARLLGVAALTAVLLLPAAVRWTGQPPLGGWTAVTATVISIGEELAFRGALFAAIRAAAGPGAAVVLSTLAWTAAHALSHPPAFLLAVCGAGLVLGLWRWFADDLVAPIGAHVMADLLL